VEVGTCGVESLCAALLRDRPLALAGHFYFFSWLLEVPRHNIFLNHCFGIHGLQSLGNISMLGIFEKNLSLLVLASLKLKEKN
jgi:hypothetical protein